MSERRRACAVLGLSALSFGACFAAWVMNGVLVTFLVDRGVFAWTRAEIGVLLGLPVLTGSLLRLPVGMLADRFGGRPVFVVVILASALGCLGLSGAGSFAGYALGSLGFGVAGASFIVAIAYTSAWFGRERQGTVLGVVGIGNLGAAATSLGAPALLRHLTDDGRNLDAWRHLPRLYAALLLLTAVAFWLLTHPRRPQGAARSLGERLAVLCSVRVWRFGLYYFFLFGAFVALGQWLVPYAMNVFGLSLAEAGALAAAFSLPCAGIRVVGGWLSDRYGARATMYGVLGVTTLGCLLLAVPPGELVTAGAGVAARAAGTVTRVSGTEIAVGPARYPLRPPEPAPGAESPGLWHRVSFHEPLVGPGDAVERNQLLARGVTRVSFRPGLTVFAVLLALVGIAFGIGMAAVYRHIPDYFPGQVGLVGGMVGVIGGLGGFVLPIVFSLLLDRTGLWSSCWGFLLLLSAVSLLWMHVVVRGLERHRVREMERRVNAAGAAGPALLGELPPSVRS